jgi:hypothetical protein
MALFWHIGPHLIHGAVVVVVVVLWSPRQGSRNAADHTLFISAF